MAATLQILNGKAAGTKYELNRDEIRIGRHPDCEVKIELSAASRFHAHIVREGEQMLIEDLGSRNKTYVNGSQIQSKVPLKDNDRVKICDVLFVFRRAAAAAPPIVTVVEEEEEHSTTVLSTYDTESAAENLVKVRPEAKLRAVLEITQATASELQVDKLFPRMLDSLFKIFPQADRAILIQRDEQDRLIPRASKHRRKDDDTVRFSRTVVRTAMEERKAMLSVDAGNDSRFSLSSSLVDLRIHSFMCAPLVVPNRPALGVLQIDTQSSTQKFNEEDLQILAAVASQAAITLDSARMHEEALSQERTNRELKLAREVQKSFLPRSMPRFVGVDFWAFYEAAGMVGGDYYDFVPLPNGRLAVLLGDVAGKGVPAALLMAKASSEARVALLTHPNDPVAAISQLNNAICEANLEGRFITVALCVLNENASKLTVVNAGHMSPIIRRANGELYEPAGPERSGLPIGVVDDYEYRLVETELAPGELVVVFSDGISEAMNSSEHEYGMERIRAQIIEHHLPASDFGPMLLDDVRGFVNGFKQHDDMTMVVFSRAAAEPSR